MPDGTAWPECVESVFQRGFSYDEVAMVVVLLIPNPSEGPASVRWGLKTNPRASHELRAQPEQKRTG